MYGPGLYTVFTKSSNNSSYGKYLYKMHVKGIKNFFIFLPEIYNKVWGTNKSYDEMIAEQNKRFKSNFYSYKDFIHSFSKEHSKVAGIIFHGNHDSDVCIIFEPKNVIPISYEKEGRSIKYETGKIDMSKKYKTNAFKHGGDIVDYLKKYKELLTKLSEGDFIKCSVSDYDRSIYNYTSDIFYVRKFKKLASINDLLKLFNIDESYHFNKYKKYFDSKSFGIYDNHKQLINIIYFDGHAFRQCKFNLYDGVPQEIAKKVFNIDCHKISSEMHNRYIYNKSKNKYESGDSHFTAGNRSDFIKAIQLPEKIKDFCKLKNADANKNVYDFTNKIEKGELVLEVGIFKNGKKAVGEDKKVLINKLKEEIKIKPEQDVEFNNWLKQGLKSFNLNLVTGKVSSTGGNSIANKIANFLETEISKTSFIREISMIIAKKARGFKEVPTGFLNKKVKNVDYKAGTSYEIIKNKNKESINKAKMNREKQEREQQGKYIGKHQYDALKSVKTYFNY